MSIGQLLFLIIAIIVALSLFAPTVLDNIIDWSEEDSTKEYWQQTKLVFSNLFKTIFSGAKTEMVEDPINETVQ